MKDAPNTKPAVSGPDEGPGPAGSPPLLKFCGIRSSGDALLAESLGADLAGFIFHPGSPRHLTPSAAAAADSGSLARVGVFVRQKAQEILEIMEEARLDLAQFHGPQTLKDASAVGPGRVLRVIWPERHASAGSLMAELSEWGGASRMFLFDAGLSGGGHGRAPGRGGAGGSAGGPLSFLEFAGKPSLLAGGLGPESLGNFPDPSGFRYLAGFDVNSGAESSPGVKDHGLMAQAASKARGISVRGRGGLDRDSLRAPPRSGRSGP
ncbi:MAG: phosphoribosylanthranilate isomerase [Deltaproteobacteria bacterium]|jgi:phosphoribosylanthranilate isomerase|nr:phosphoribosylanthranilate isomerase [Deltaproteobacteria bacterium]